MRRGFLSGSLALLLMVVMSSCSTNETCADLGTCPNTAEERTDIQITGELDIWDNQIVDNGVLEQGPISFNYYGNPSEKFDFVIKLESGHTLVLRMVNRGTPNPQDQVEVSYSAYPGQDLDQKLRYVTAELRVGNDAPAYSTNLSGNINPIIIKGAFRIISNDGNQIRARIQGLELYHNISNNKKIEINGTFVAVSNYSSGI